MYEGLFTSSPARIENGHLYYKNTLYTDKNSLVVLKVRRDSNLTIGVVNGYSFAGGDPYLQVRVYYAKLGPYRYFECECCTGCIGQCGSVQLASCYLKNLHIWRPLYYR
ncbi:uncharacterized protein LOC111699440 [Eurytemora carolleeae]|uniref:uncharacterized protein LOC111699440 n=1 Tax=Eurytemora carolleeae TaxID=1294199 RepID=UPI000C76C683|nr:uncharacterized protein LOC111699440 [Eurytemora carolleeae]|eukprot:XP_023325887.1 uncharacterized protein LOC111699440 [Eurytemora affinis]